jgi:hypothetical protein
VQRVAPRAITQAADGRLRERRAELGREVAQLGLGEPGQRDGGAGLAVDDRRRPSGSPVTASRTPIRTSTGSATSRRTANSNADNDGRSAQCASSTTTTTTASSSSSNSWSSRVPTVTGVVQ